MGKVGRKTSFNDAVQETILRLIKDGKTEDKIAQIIGVSLRTIQNWKGKHPQFLHAVRESRIIADELVEASMFSRAVGYSHPEEKVFCDKGDIVIHRTEKHYPPDVQAGMFWLRNRQPDRWKEKTDGDVTVNNNLNLKDMTDDQLKSKIEELLAKRQK